jgi:ribosome biogenesis GTPase / thiamine phosphate phosphatase
MKGIITKSIGGFFFTTDSKGNIYRNKIRGKVKERVYPGDWVEFDNGMIESIYPRINLLIRPVVANVDQVLIMHSLIKPSFDRKLLDRYLLIVESFGLKPLLIINKIDLYNEKDYEIIMEDYVKANYKVFFISIKEKRGLEHLFNNLDTKINVLTGPSGVGKSSLINLIVKNAYQLTNKVSKKSKKGVHTTRQIELLPLDEGWIADTPGFTSLDISYIKKNDLAYFFPEMNPYIDKCKFSTCSHIHEPFCAVKEAVEKGIISCRRYESYKSFYHELS